MGEELVKLCIQNCHYINRRNTRITIIAFEAEAIHGKIQAKHTNIKEVVDINTIEHNPHHITNIFIRERCLTDVDVIYVCAMTDNLQASYSLKAREVFDKNIPIVRWFTKLAITETSNKEEFEIYTVPLLDVVAKYEDIIDNTVDHKAIAIHHRWLKREITNFIKKVEESVNSKKKIPELKATLAPWHLLDEEIRDDNRSVVEHNVIKLRTFGQLNNPDDFEHPENAKVDFGFLFSDEKKGEYKEDIVEKLAEMEHRRWMATKFFYGWEYNEKRQDDKKIHDSLIPFDDTKLDKGTKAYDIEQIKELKEVWEV
jgi:hypothetical protein